VLRIFLYGPVPPVDIALNRFLCRLSPLVLLSSVACCLSRISGSRSFSTFLAVADRVLSRLCRISASFGLRLYRISVSCGHRLYRISVSFGR
jgi:hypothetical protein